MPLTRDDALPRRTVLVVDDEPSVLKVLSRGLPSFGYNAIAVTDLDSAVTVLRDSQVDALIVDLRLVGHSGLDVLAYLRSVPSRTAADLPALMFTGLNDVSEDEQDTIRRHGAHVFYKMGGIAPMMATLDTLFRGPGLAAA